MKNETTKTTKDDKQRLGCIARVISGIDMTKPNDNRRENPASKAKIRRWLALQDIRLNNDFRPVFDVLDFVNALEDGVLDIYPPPLFKRINNILDAEPEDELAPITDADLEAARVQLNEPETHAVTKYE